MDFERARSSEQKSIRLQQIKDATLELYETVPYDKINFASISERLNFSRVNIYKYVSSKEEILLMILSDEVNGWVQDEIIQFENYENLDIDTFSSLWAYEMYKHKRLLELFSILNTILVENVREENFIAFHKGICENFSRLNSTLKRLLPFLTSDKIMKFNEFQVTYIKGLYPLKKQTDIQRKAVELSGLPVSYIIQDFVPAFTEFLTAILNGLHA